MINEKLVMIFDNISHKTGFYYGRYDIKCTSLEDLYKENFIILEFNGAGSVPNHIYTGGYTLLSAYREILKHWNAMFRISKANNQKGFYYWNFLKGYRFFKNSKKYFNVLKKLDKELALQEA
jgi:hypothetical protein